MKNRGWLGAGLALALAGCSSSSSDDPMGQANGFCYAIAPSGASASCQGCSLVSKAGAAFDGSLDSGATMGAGGQGTFAGTAGTQPAGRVAGVYYIVPPAPRSINVSIRTMQNGVVQQTSSVATSPNVCPIDMDCIENGNEGFIGLQTTLDFNGIEATVSNGSASAIQVRELCVR